MQVKNMETEIEKSFTLKWPLRQQKLLGNQEKFINTMVGFLVKNPDASIAVYPMLYTEKEKEHILFFEAKKKYFLFKEGKKGDAFDEDDSLKVDNMSVKDSLMVNYLNKNFNGNMLFTIQEKCTRYIGSAVVENRFKQLTKEREDAFLFFFKKKEVANRVRFNTVESTIPYNGFSFYKIVYKGEFPEAIIQAYRKMNELNDEVPRKKFKEDRKKAKADLKEQSKIRK